jgi:hypothetical protein
MAIFVPPGDRRDPTRLPEFYDGTFEYLTGIGLAQVWNPLAWPVRDSPPSSV